MLEQRFSDLASNHEELIRFKDEYKMENQKLRGEVSKLKEEGRKETERVERERGGRVTQLEQEVKKKMEEKATLQQACK